MNVCYVCMSYLALENLMDDATSILHGASYASVQAAFVYACMYVCMWYIHTWMDPFVCTYVSMHARVYVMLLPFCMVPPTPLCKLHLCMHACMYVCVCVYVLYTYMDGSVCVHVCMHACMYVCM